MARIYLHKAGQAAFTPTTQSRIELPRNFHMHNLVCKLVVNHDNAAAVSLLSGGFLNLINQIQIVSNGSKTHKHVDTKKLSHNTLYNIGKNMTKSVVTTVSSAGNISTIYFAIDFSMLGMARPYDTIENTALYTTFDMLIDWASEASIGTGVTVNSATLFVSSNELVGYARNPGERIAHNIETQLSKEITSSTTEFQIDLPVKKVYRRLLIAATVDGVVNNSVVNSVKLKSGTTVIAEWDADDLRAFNIRKNRIITESDADGLLLIDFCARGKLSDALDTNGQFNTLELVLSVTKQAGTNNVTVYTDEFQTENTVEVQK
ncbi:hypothetical protein WCX49_06680 [Sulfurimonas sp. HSL-1656]|uniref:hypothetical protein n=1 Tax=Thiomicrolovo subterrani TaxID=3131934 RepID=UPI0031F8FD39